ncbi:hypothetical protein Ancab_004979 [Ancistrocladus abbreviatus]
MVYTGKYPPYNNEKQSVNNGHKFYLVLEDLFDKLSNQAANDSSRQMFAVGRAKVSRTKVYGLVECTRDISAMIVPLASKKHWEILKGVAFLMTGGWFLVGIVMSDEDRGESALISALSIPPGFGITEEGELVFVDELPFMDLNTIRAATDDFSDSNKFEQGGFGIVYAGVLCDGTKIAVKRLSRRSSQGIEEFKNEIILIAKLQHRNLVRLLGRMIEGEEKMLVYEYMPNKSLELFIFGK